MSINEDTGAVILEQETLMTLRHVDEMVALTGGKYDDLVNVAFSAVLHIMVLGNKQNMDGVIKDLRMLADHYIERCEIVKRENLSATRTLH